MPKLFDGVLLKGEENAIVTKDLLTIMGIDDARTLRRLVSEERAAGEVILSSDKGYFFPDDGAKGRAETRAFIATVTAKGASTLKAAKSAQRFLETLPGQMVIDKKDAGGKRS